METISIKRLEKVKQLDKEKGYSGIVCPHTYFSSKTIYHTLRLIDETQRFFDNLSKEDLEFMRKCFRLHRIVPN